jgi:hypothetical protein
MAFYHTKKDSLRQLMLDAEDPENPQHGIPDSIRESALEELRSRGYNEQAITDIRLGRHPEQQRMTRN